MIYACEHHDQVLSHWREHDLRGIALAHVDFHDDMRGLLVDRRRHVAYAIGKLARGEDPADPGNFLAHAITDGRIQRVRWIHDLPGGRGWDMGIVRFERDIFALPQRVRHAYEGGEEYRLRFEELLLDRWQGVLPGERLSVDWDCFASILLDAGDIPRRVETFLNGLGDSVPSETYVVYSPEYSHPTLDEFRGLLNVLAQRFNQPLKWLSTDLEQGRLNPTSVDARLPTGFLQTLILRLRRMGIY